MRYTGWLVRGVVNISRIRFTRTQLFMFFFKVIEKNHKYYLAGAFAIAGEVWTKMLRRKVLGGIFSLSDHLHIIYANGMQSYLKKSRFLLTSNTRNCQVASTVSFEPL